MSRTEVVTTFGVERAQPVVSSVPGLDVAQLTRQLVLSVREAARLLGISKDLAYELVRRDELPSLGLGRRLVIPVRPLLKLVGVEKHAVANNEAAHRDG